MASYIKLREVQVPPGEGSGIREKSEVLEGDGCTCRRRFAAVFILRWRTERREEKSAIQDERVRKGALSTLTGPALAKDIGATRQIIESSTLSDTEKAEWRDFIGKARHVWLQEPQ